MSKFHINNNGVPAPCKAKEGNCPLGSNEQHFSSKEEAQVYADTQGEQLHGILPEVSNKTSDERMQELYNDLVPPSGRALTIAGELVRASNRIGYRFYNDGDKVDSGYGKETCNSSLRYLTEQLDSLDNGKQVANKFSKLWDGDSLNNEEYDKVFKDGIKDLVEFIDSNPSLKSKSNDKDSISDFSIDEDFEDDEEEFGDAFEDDSYDEFDY